MKYKKINQVIPQEKRKEINDKIIHLVDTGKAEKYNVTKEIIYNSYTGDGGLHGLKFSDFDSYYAYGEAKKAIEGGQFFTEHDTVKYLSEILNVSKNDLVIDLTSGIGNMFNFMPNECNCYGNELELKAYKISKYLYPKANIENGDMAKYKSTLLFDYSIGNPPFNIRMKYKGEHMDSQMVYVRKSYDLLKPGGILAVIVPKSFLNDDFVNGSDIEYFNEHFNFICQIELKADTFKHVGVDKYETKIMIFSKKSLHLSSNKFRNEFVSGSADEIYNKYIEPFYKEKEELKNQIYLEALGSRSKNTSKIFDDKVKKLLFDIGRTKSIKHKYNECKSYYEQYYRQEKPISMNIEDWEKVRIRKYHVVDKLSKILSNQHVEEKDIIRLVKKGDKLALKGYSEKTRQEVEGSEKYIYECVYNNTYEFEDRTYKKLIDRKRKQYEIQSVDIEEMTIDDKIYKWTSQMIYPGENWNLISLNKQQLEVVNKALQKKYFYLQMEQGSGKTLSGITYALYRHEFSNVKNTLVVGPSIAINMTWDEALNTYGISYVNIKALKDIDKIKNGDFVIVSFGMLHKYKRQLKKYFKKKSNKFTLILDEADNIGNIDTNNFTATYTVGFKAKYKLLLSGTMTRNNINEAFTQFILLYGSSVNMMCENKYIYKQDKDTKKLMELYNENYLKPFPNYKKGLTVFKQSFSPAKVSVFGVEKMNQDIYNSECLKALINKTIITRTFKQIVGREIHTIHRHMIDFSKHEENMYDIAVNKFNEMHYLFKSTGNSRKDSMMRIIQQLNTLIDICCNPQGYREYKTLEVPPKYSKVLELTNSFKNEYVAIGCRTIKEVENYHLLLSNSIKDRDIFVITGSTSISDRKDIIKQLRASGNGVLISTQQSLSSSVSIEFVDKVIITSLSWNWSTLTQYFYRFIRYNSERLKEIHFVTYKNSIEANILGLIKQKEVLTNFMKNESINELEIDEKLGIDFDLLELILTKEKDSEGRTYINWATSKIS